MIIIVICVIMVMGKAAPFSVRGSAAHIKEVNEVKNLLLEVNIKINFSGIGIGSVLLLIILVIMERVTHHVVVKNPNKVAKREKRSQIKGLIEHLEGIMK